ncbi:hypothetical protein ASE63_22520 [Bosea sp. Root381]|uniref:hypothetical protein n=1 Tax=Bosea sp. Root381 TaxID=1736524 RepID=UPI000701CACE|nr:hypothetical protein [Bosea sp. Root381]KRE07477.1 hypothetical protein ASE63_22520 [Bosea sp. Root381]
MSALLAGLLTEFWKPLAALFGGVLAGAGIWFKARSDAKTKAKLEDITNANTIRRDGAAARAGAAVDPDRLRDSDGWKRD